ncbi:hypothetical protein N8261_05210 [Flavobacteriaceae bacterium]|nr:hypothetical protein [Flavobacteriaceae bacterium]
MKSTSQTTNMNFNTFLRGMSLFILNRCLAIIELLLVTAGSLCLFLAHICISSVDYIENYIMIDCDFDYYSNADHLNHIIRDKINLYIGKRDDVIIKEEKIEDEDSSEDEVEYELDSDIEDVTNEFLQKKEEEKVTVDLTVDVNEEEELVDEEVGDTETTISQTNVIEDEESSEINSDEDLMTI